MPNLRVNSLKLNAPAAFLRKNAKGLIVLLVGVLLGTFIVVGQQGEQVKKKDIPVADRFEKAIKDKEPKFKVSNKLERDNKQQKYVLQGWQSDEDLVSATTYELASKEEAAELLRKSLQAPTSVPVRTIRLTQLGDEAYMRPNNYSKEGQTDLLFRKGKFVIVLSASSPGVAKRFARHMARELND